ncbi:MAG TPA: NYN domain-containing protein [Bacilli bacterium]
MDEYLIVDGYNIIGSWPELIKLKEINLEEARDKLIEMLADYKAYSGMHVTVIFDAHQVQGLGGKYKQSKLDILYTREKETADECIERLVTELSSRRVRIYVATSDSVEQHVTFGKGALRLAARELLHNMEESRKEIRSQISNSRPVRRNAFDIKLSSDMKDIFEKWRRGK